MPSMPSNVRRELYISRRQQGARYGKHQERDSSQNRPGHSELLGEAKLTQVRLSARQLDRALSHHEEGMQDCDACDDDGRNCHRAAAERDYPHRRGHHQPGQRFEEAERSERNLRERSPELLAKGNCHVATMPAEIEPSVWGFDKIEGKDGFALR